MHRIFARRIKVVSMIGWVRETELPPEARYVRTTPTFTEETVPAGLLSAHRVAASTWGVLRVTSGGLGFSFADEQVVRRLAEGERQVIPPEQPHALTIDKPVIFEIDFYRLESDSQQADSSEDA